MKKELKRGDVVTVYEDPMTKTKPEGEAVLRALHSGDPEGQRWYVRFKGESQDVLRLIWNEPDPASVGGAAIGKSLSP